MAITYNIGLSKIETGDIENDGGVSTSFEVLSDTFKDSASITQDTNETHDFEVEEKDDPIASIITKKGTSIIKWSMTDWDPDMLVKIWGGTVVSGEWQAPEVLPLIEKSVRVTPKTGGVFTYTRCSISATVNYELTRTGIALIVVEAKMLQPKKANEPSWKWG